MKLKVKINQIKNLNNVDVELPLTPGLYAIAGENGSGKSTLLACAASLFRHDPDWLDNFIGESSCKSFIDIQLGSKHVRWEKKEIWKMTKRESLGIKGFFEGSLIFGTRFTVTSYGNIGKLKNIELSKLNEAPEFIRHNLGYILHDDEHYYPILRKLNKRHYSFPGDVFFYQKDDKLISQFHMSTGENLLISILNSLFYRLKDKDKFKDFNVLFLDEIELALHPAALMRLIDFLRDMSQKEGLTVYFSTHSIELLSNINPQNIFSIEHYSDNTIEFVNPCYPAYVARNLYVNGSYDDIILVEDDLAKRIIDRILVNNGLTNQRLILVQPAGGWHQVLSLASDAVKFKFLGRLTSISVILDKDVQQDAIKEIQTKRLNLGNKINFLPIESLEKYLKHKLTTDVDTTLFKRLNDSVFKSRSLKSIIDEYSKDIKNIKDKDKSGKHLFYLLQEEMNRLDISRKDIIDLVVEHLENNDPEAINKTLKTLQQQLHR